MKIIQLAILSLALFLSCKSDNSDFTVQSNKLTPYEAAVSHPMTEFKGMTIDSRFLPPEGYTRVPAKENSFASYLRKLPLKTPGSKVLLFDGTTKQNEVHEAVIDLPIGDKDLHQCADAIMRLKAEHHWLQKEYEKIYFHFTNGFRVEYNEWRKGKKMIVNGNRTYWDRRKREYTESYSSFWEYMELIFTYAGTMSLSVSLDKTSLDDIQIGDIFVQGGSPGHAVLVVDLAENEEGEKIFMLAQSYMPAQEIHILKNQGSEISPWYSIPESNELLTPEWTFKKSDLKRFRK